jgi:hypothetical protein
VSNRDYFLQRYGNPGLRKELERQAVGLEAQLAEFIIGPPLRHIRKEQYIEATEYAKHFLTPADGPAYQNLLLDAYADCLREIIDVARKALLDEHRRRGNAAGEF